MCASVLCIYLSVCLSVCLSVYLSVRPSVRPSIHLSIYLSINQSIIRKNASQICHDQFSWYLDTMIIRWGDNRDVQEFGVKGHLGVIWSRCSNMLKTLLHLHNSIDFDGTWGEVILGQRFLRGVQEILIGGCLGVFRVAFDNWVFSLLKTAAKELSVSHMISAWVNIYPLCSLLFWNLGFRFTKSSGADCRVNRFKTYEMISAWVNTYPFCSLLFWNLGFRFNKEQWCRVHRLKTPSSWSSCGLIGF